MTGPDGRIETIVAVAASSPFAVRMAQLLAMVGTAAIAAGVWLQAASMRVASLTAEGQVGALVDTGLAAVLSALGEALAKLKAPVALVFVGTALLVTAGFISIEMLPAREGSALSNITSTIPATDGSTPGPTTSPSPGTSATPAPTPSLRPTPTPTPSPG